MSVSGIVPRPSTSVPGVGVDAADADPERRLDDALDLLVQEARAPLVEAVGLAQPLALGQRAHARARRAVARTTMNRQGCNSPTEGRGARPRARAPAAGATGSGRKRRMSRRPSMTCASAARARRRAASRRGSAARSAAREGSSAGCSSGRLTGPPPRARRRGRCRARAPASTARVDRRARSPRPRRSTGPANGSVGAGQRRDADRVGGRPGRRAVVVGARHARRRRAPGPWPRSRSGRR